MVDSPRIESLALRIEVRIFTRRVPLLSSTHHPQNAIPCDCKEIRLFALRARVIIDTTENGYFRNFMSGISQKFWKFRPSSMRAIRYDYFDSTCERFCITAKPTWKWMYFFRHCLHRFSFTVFYAHNLLSLSLPSPSLSFSLFLALLHRITFFYGLQICFRKQRPSGRGHIFVFEEIKAIQREKERWPKRTHKDLSRKLFEFISYETLFMLQYYVRDRQNLRTIRLSTLREFFAET